MSNDTPKESPKDSSKDSPKDPRAARIRSKIDASQKRVRGEGAPRKAKAAPRKRASGETGFIEKAMADHPLALLAGSVVLGAIAASLVPRSWGSKLGSRALGLAAIAGELGATFGSKAWSATAEGARVGQDKLEDLGESLADRSSQAGRKATDLGLLAGKRALELAGLAAKNARDASDSALKAIGDLKTRARH
ncbi:hypothetical protein [Novosphingobium sp. Gsoil 351]|uniref:hypothetical protein n=1 Tax=Novosphingobium sp. Gsoil 351 TaxID=2675225 RepID=UPI0012B4621D|nr:hypothetical protein [Novosphingobium sp. Gsoil 351]QGN53877.1 hypothetical protein GKE62_04355 [Novosphingobium sp. Gsoil 351]